MHLNIILPALSPKIQAYDLISCDLLCDHSHMPLYHQRKRKIKKRNNKSRKIDKRKEKY